MQNTEIKTKVIETLEKEIKNQLDCTEVDYFENLIEKGLSSIMIMKLSNKLRKYDIKISFAKLMEQPYFNTWKDLINNYKINKKDSYNSNKKTRNYSSEEFFLTDIQYAYWVGREDNQTLGGIGCHAYLEISGGSIDRIKLNDSWNILQKKHPMLRVKITKNGTQIIMDTPYSEQINIYDLSLKKQAEIDDHLLKIRNKLSHRKLKVEDGEVAGLGIAILPNNKSRIFLDVDLLVADVMSLSIIIDDLARIYNGENVCFHSNYTFKNYIEEKKDDKSKFRADKEFWEKKLDALPKEPPNLPLQKKPELINNIKFNRRKEILEKSRWNKLKRMAEGYKATPSMVLLTCYALVIERWTNQEKFLINIPLFNRDIENNKLQYMVADFTELLLVEYERKNKETFLEVLNRLKRTFLENVSHSAYTGVQVQRDISKKLGSNSNVAPIIFACNIDYKLETELSKQLFGRINYMISQTPQTWLDFQMYIIDDDLVLCWDAIEDLFPEKVLDDMFSSLINLINKLIDNVEWNKMFNTLPERQIEERIKELKGILPLEYPEKNLHSSFINNMNNNPESIAIIDAESENEISYRALYNKAISIAHLLSNYGVKRGDYVGITIPRGFEQIYIILGIMLCGAAYVPIGINQPRDRRNKIYEQIGIDYVVSNFNTIEKYRLYEEKLTLIDIDESIKIDNKLFKPTSVSPEDSAYVIMTSGTTGMPKGVEVSHQSAVNTIDDINVKYSINKDDSVLMVSAIDFDLSVYDIFGLLSAGGTIVTLNEENYKDPYLWIKLIYRLNISIWNSVPVLFDMLVTAAEGRKEELLLRLALLSGDWIAVNLPSRFYKINNNSNIIALGGATEASIWSNYIEVPKEIPEYWNSIPYGQPLKNQIYRIVDDFSRITPNYVKGELLIGGVGVAKCYRGDESLTKNKFIYSEGIRWYKTGDNGRMWNDGTIEFLGRKDSQVKIKGHRIELGEIEEALKKIKRIKNAVVDIKEEDNKSSQLVAYLEIIDDNLNSQKFMDNAEEKKRKKLLETDFYGNIKSEYYNGFLENADRLACEVMINTLKSQGIFEYEKSYYLNEIIEMVGVDNKQIRTVKKWLKDLVSIGMVEKNDEGYSYNRSFTDGSSVIVENRLISPVGEYIKSLESYLVDLIKGRLNPVEIFYSEDKKLSPSYLAKAIPGGDELIELILGFINKIFKDSEEKINILEYGTRDTEMSKRIITELSNIDMNYIYADSSLLYTNMAKRDLNNYENIEYIKNDFNNDLNIIEYNNFDCIIALNSLHRSTNIKKTLMEMKRNLNNYGILIIQEISTNTYLQDISATILNNNADLPEMEIDSINWKLLLEECGFNTIYSYPKNGSYCGRNIYIAINDEAVNENFASDFIYKEVSKYLPNYMIPRQYHILNKIPLNRNSKIDRNLLKEQFINKDRKKRYEDKPSVLEEKLLEIWKYEMSNDDIFTSSNFYHLGGDSLIATRIASKVQVNFKVDFTISDVMQLPTIKEQSQKILELKKTKNREILPSITSDIDGIYDEFSLTDVQHAYFIGRTGFYNMGKVSTHSYFEIDSEGINLEHLEDAWNDLIDINHMMRVIISKKGKQRILKEVPRYRIRMNDLRNMNKQNIKNSLNKTRHQMSHQVLKIDEWPVFEIRASLLPEEKSRIHISFDNMIFDGWSMFYLLEEWTKIYRKESGNIINNNISFRDYVLYLEEVKKSEVYKRDKKYWLERKRGFLEAPQLPTVMDEEEIREQRFKRREAFLEQEDFESLKEVAKMNGVTLITLIITMYSDTIRLWSRNKDFTLNITQFNKLSTSSNIDNLVGDFTTLTLLEIKNSNKDKLIDRAKVVQKQMINDLNHRTYSGVEFQRNLRKKANNRKKSLMPIVFTSGLGISSFDEGKWFGELIYNISQTPQVWLDHQVVGSNGGLSIFWDSVDVLFEKNLIDDMFSYYISSLVELARNPERMEKEIFVKDQTLMNEELNYGEISIIERKKSDDIKYIEPFSNHEKMIKLWRSILSEEISSIDDKFFELGGDSLKALDLMSAVEHEFGVDLELSVIFENPSIKELMAKVSQSNEVLCADEGTI